MDGSPYDRFPEIGQIPRSQRYVGEDRCPNAVHWLTVPLRCFRSLVPGTGLRADAGVTSAADVSGVPSILSCGES